MSTHSKFLIGLIVFRTKFLTFYMGFGIRKNDLRPVYQSVLGEDWA